MGINGRNNKKTSGMVQFIMHMFVCIVLPLSLLFLLIAFVVFIDCLCCLNWLPLLLLLIAFVVVIDCLCCCYWLPLLFLLIASVVFIDW